MNSMLLRTVVGKHRRVGPHQCLSKTKATNLQPFKKKTQITTSPTVDEAIYYLSVSDNMHDRSYRSAEL